MEKSLGFSSGKGWVEQKHSGYKPSEKKNNLLIANRPKWLFKHNLCLTLSPPRCPASSLADSNALN